MGKKKKSKVKVESPVALLELPSNPPNKTLEETTRLAANPTELAREKPWYDHQVTPIHPNETVEDQAAAFRGLSMPFDRTPSVSCLDVADVSTDDSILPSWMDKTSIPLEQLTQYMADMESKAEVETKEEVKEPFPASEVGADPDLTLTNPTQEACDALAKNPTELARKAPWWKLQKTSKLSLNITKDEVPRIEQPPASKGVPIDDKIGCFDMLPDPPTPTWWQRLIARFRKGNQDG